jgi:hypothetical protein
MKLNELSNLRMERAQALMDRVNALMMHASKRAGTVEARADSVDMLRLACEAWDENDGLSVYVESVKAQINIPSIGMSIADAELWLHSLERKRTFLESLVELIREREPDASDADIEAEQSGTEVGHPCPTCGVDFSPPIDMELVATLVAEVRAEITRLASAIERAVCSVETTWHDRDSGAVTKAAPVERQTDGPRSGMQVVGEVVIPAVEPPPPVPVPMQQPVPQPQQMMVQTFQVVDPSCHVCMSPGRVALERHWLATRGDTVTTLELGLVHGVIPQNMTPQLMQMHFDDHVKASDHGLAT